MTVLELLFEHLGNLPPLRSQHETLPHLRRVARTLALHNVRANTVSDVQGRIHRRVQRKRQHLHALCAEHRLPLPDLVGVLPQLEATLDQPGRTWPSALTPTAEACTRWLPKPAQEDVLGVLWSLMTTLMLLPPQARVPRPDVPPDAYLAHWEMIRCEGLAARERVLLGTVRYVQKRATNFIGQGLPYSDLFQEGVLGLWKAIPRYREWYGVPFQSCSAHWIAQRIGRAIAVQSRTVRLPVHMLDRLEQAQRALPPPDGDDEDHLALERLLATEFNMKRGVLWGLRAAAMPLRFDERTSIADDDGTALALGDALADDGGIGAVDERLDGELLRSAIDALHPRGTRDQGIIALRYGLDDGVARTLEEVGQHVGVTRERIRQIEERLLRRARQHLRHVTRWYPHRRVPPRDQGHDEALAQWLRAIPVQHAHPRGAAAAAERAWVVPRLPKRMRHGRRRAWPLPPTLP